MSAYISTGTVAVANGSPTVTGTGTSWNGVIVAGHLFIGPDGQPYGILSVNSDTTLTLTRPYRSATASGQDYEIDTTRGADRDLLIKVTQLVETFQSASDIASQFENTKIPGYDAQIANLVANTYDDLAANVASDMPVYNLFADSGRYNDPITRSYLVGTGFGAPAFFTPTNGGSDWAAIATFTHGASSQAEPVASLFSRYGINRSVGVEFHIAEMTAGNGTSVAVTHNGQSYNLLTTNLATMLPREFTVGFYIRVVSGGVHVGFQHDLDGVDTPADTLPLGGWRHVRIKTSSGSGVYSSVPNLRALPGSRVQMALPYFVPGHFADIDHTAVRQVLAAGAYA